MALDNLHEWLATREWQSTFDGRTLARGREYAPRDHVTESHLENASETRCVLAGMVEGTRSDPYSVTITIQRSDSRLILDAECSCPVGAECKHAAALLFLSASCARCGNPRHQRVLAPGAGQGAGDQERG